MKTTWLTTAPIYGVLACASVALAANHLPAAQSSSFGTTQSPGEALGLAPRSTSKNGTAAACEAARKALGEEIVQTAPLGQAEIEANWSEACWKEPACIIQPETAEHVATAIKILTRLEAPFAVRSGGHSPNAGWSSIDKPGVLIDLSHLDEISVSDDAKTVAVGPGQRWGAVYEALDPYGVSAIGGRIPNVGVGGLILGGGYFHFSPAYGLAVDHVKEFEVVLASGEIVTATAWRNRDLYWALKGGGPNFGIVTRFVLKTVPLHDIWYEVHAVANDQAHAVLDAFAKWQETGASDTKATVALVMGLDIITLGFIYAEPAAERPESFAAFKDITPLVTPVPPTNGNIVSLSAVVGATGSTAPMRHDYRAASSKVDNELYKDVYDFWLKKAKAVNAATGANQTFTLQPVSAQLGKAGDANSGNPLGIPRETHQWWTTLVDWEDAADDEVVRSVSIDTSAKWAELSKKRGLAVDFVYLNDAAADQNPIASYGADNIANLKEIAAKFDPDEVFQKLQNDGFLLSKV